MIRIITMLAFVLLALAACGGRKSADADADAQAPVDKAAEQAAAKKQKTVFDDQLKALDKAKAVEQQLQDDKDKRDKALQEQENGG